MPELPEVEATCRGIAPYIQGQTIARVLVRERRLRWSVATDLKERVAKQSVQSVGRRGKYLLLQLDHDALIIHLGMAGSLALLTENKKPGKHDHWDIEFDNGLLLRFNDPRRFGSLHVTAKTDDHPLLENLGVEPLGPDFDGEYLVHHARNRRAPIKHFLMNARIVAGIGNIYACEALYLAGIHPKRRADRISHARYNVLSAAVKKILNHAIRRGGTTLRDFLNADGAPGYFSIVLKVYGRDDAPCRRCGHTIKRITQGGRGTWYCPGCQR